MASYDLFDAFNDCIDRLNAGQGLEDCLRAHPQYAERLRPLLETAILVQRVRPPVPAGAQARVRERVLRAAPASPARFRFAPSGLALAAASVLAIGFVVALFWLSNRPPAPALRPELTVSVTASATPVGTSAVTPTQAPTMTATASATPTATASVTPSRTPTPSVSPTPTIAASPTATFLAPCTFTVVPASINLRSGPGTGYAIIGYGFAGETFTVIARHSSGLWYQLQREEAEPWAAASVGTLSGDCAALPALDLPLREGTTGASVTPTPVLPGGATVSPAPAGATITPAGATITPAGDDHGDDDGDDDGEDDHSGPGEEDDDAKDEPDDD